MQETELETQYTVCKSKTKIWQQKFSNLCQLTSLLTGLLHLCYVSIANVKRRQDIRQPITTSKLINRPVFSGTVPVWDTLSRNPERCLRDVQISRFSSKRPGRDRTQST